MSEDLNSKIKQIAELLGQDGLPDNLKGILSALTSTSNKEEATSVPKAERQERNELDENVDMIRKVKKVMDKFNTKDDPRINLLNAIHPFLNGKRQKKLSSCIKILHMTKLAGFVDDHDKNK